MKFLSFAIVSFLSMAAVAAPSQSEIDQKGLEIAFKKSDSLQTMAGQKLATSLAAELPATGGTINKVTNSCVEDVEDIVFECQLVISNVDKSGQTESSTSIRYELEKETNGLPSDDLLTVSITVKRAG